MKNRKRASQSELRRHSRRPGIETIEPRNYCSISFDAPKVLPRSVNEAGLGSIVAGDFGNGHPDVAALDQGTNGSAGSIQVFLNNGIGKFTLSQTLATGGGSQFMQLSDLYGNGKQDLIVSNAADGTLDIFAGNGNGTFAASPTVVAFGPQEVLNGPSVFADEFRIGNLLGPGSPSGIVVANQYAGDAVVLQLDANQQLNVVQTIPIPLADFALVDVTGDGLAEIVEASATDVSAYDNQAGMFAATPSASFSLNLPADYNANYQQITTGDFAGNGMTDLAVDAQPDSTLLAANPNTPGMLSVLMAQAGGGFAPAVLSSEPADDQQDVAADINGDKELDLITQSASSSDILLGNGDGTFTDQTLQIPDAGLGQFGVADFNGDGTTDFVTVDSADALAFYANQTADPDIGAAELSPIITRTTLAPAIVAGSSVHGTAFMNVTDSDLKAENGVVAMAVYASSDGTFDSDSTLLGSVTRKLTIKPGGSVAVPIAIKSLPAALNGNYTLVAVTTNSAGSVATENGPMINIAGPYISFSEALAKTTLPAAAVSGQTTHAIAQIQITNGGNIVSKGITTIALYVTTDGVASDGMLIASTQSAVVLKPGASKLVTVALRNLPTVADGNYFLVAQVTDPLEDITTAASAATYNLSAPFVSLVPAITSNTLPATIVGGSRLRSLITISVNNQGNVAAVGISNVAVYASSDGTVASGTLLVSQPFRSTINAGKSTKVGMMIDTFANLLAGNYFLVVAVTDPAGHVQMTASAGVYTVT